jgi:hypothetical protein
MGGATVLAKEQASLLGWPMDAETWLGQLLASLSVAVLACQKACASWWGSLMVKEMVAQSRWVMQ